MSGVAGGQRIQLADVDCLVKSFKDNVLSGFKQVKETVLSGSIVAKKDPSYGDLDLIVHFDATDKAAVKQDIIASIKDNRYIVPFLSEKHSGKPYYNSGEMISVLFLDTTVGYPVQVDIIIALSKDELSFKKNFLDMEAAKQGLLLGLSKVVLHLDGQDIYSKIGFKPNEILDNQKYEFALSSSRLTLYLVTEEDNLRTREVAWSSISWTDVKSLFIGFDTSLGFDDLLKQIHTKVDDALLRSRIAGIFKSMVSIKSGEIGKPKADNKQRAIDKVTEYFG